jgi:hypothetical protein
MSSQQERLDIPFETTRQFSTMAADAVWVPRAIS